MKYVFHAVAGGLLVSLIALKGLKVPTPAPQPDPQAQLISLMQASGFVHLQSQRLMTSESLLTFRHTACEAPTEILYLPALNHISDASFARIAQHRGNRTFVHDGETVAGLDTWHLMPRWAWRRALVAIGALRPQAWESTALAMLHTDVCDPNAIDWQTLTAMR